MLTDETFCKMDLKCVYCDGIISEIPRGFYVYLILTDGNYYVGQTENLYKRVYSHKKTNTNNITSDNARVYILEKVNYTDDMRIMEVIWITWFCLNTDSCINKEKGSYKIRCGIINTRTICIIESKYNVFCEYEYIKGIKLLDKQNHVTVLSEIEYFGKAL